MTDTPPAEPETAAVKPKAKRRSLGLRIAAWTAGVAASLVGFTAFGAIILDTAPGHRLLIGLAEAVPMQNGLKIRLGAIDGSIYRRLTLRDLTLSDPKGSFLTTPALTIDWRPGALFDNHILLQELSADTVRVLRAPALKPGKPPPPNQPLLPDVHLTLARLHVGSLILEPALTGDRRSLGLDGSAELLEGRARADLQAQARVIDGHAGGDRLSLKLDAAPDQNRLTLDARLVAPQGGVVGRLAKLDAPLTFALDGRGDWKAWNGRAVATLGGQPLLDAALTGRDGQFGAKGRAQPTLILKAAPAALTAPQLDFALSGRMQDRQLDAQAELASSAFQLTGGGRFDLARSRYVGVKARGVLLKPEAASPQLNGREVRASLALDGAFAQPVIDYDLQAVRIGFGATVIENLKASGKARVDAQQTLRLPVHATADRVIGVNEAVGGLVTHLRADGDLSISAKQIASDNLRLRSDRLDATLVLALSLDTGRYDAALKGRINRYELKGLGLLDVVTDAKLIPTGKGQFRIAGHIRGQTLRIDNGPAADFLGGNAIVDADFSRTPEGAFGVANLRLSAPKFHLTEGQGSYGVDGRIRFHARARSEPYGPATLDVSGSVDRPLVHLTAPGVPGGPFTDLNLDLKGTGANAYLVTARSGSAYGPVSAEVALKTAPGMLTADIRRASLGDLKLAGQLRQTPAGPFAGALTLAGSGLNGRITLAAAGGDQRADLTLRAREARLPLTPAITIAQGSVEASAILRPQGPQVTADASFKEVRQAELLVANAKAKVDYRAGTGRIDISADGQSGVPFTIVANAGLSPDLIRVNGQGSVNRVPIRLASPAEIRKEPAGYRLAPTTVTLPQGRLDLSGVYGDRTSAAVKLDNLDLSIAQAFAPDLGIAGKASGALNFDLPKGADMPTGRADLKVVGFSRSGLGGASEPVDLTMLGDLKPTGAELHAVVRRRGGVIGRLQARLGPAAPGAGAWVERLRTAPLNAGLRYNGPSEVLWALAGVSGQELSGPLAVGADVSGRLDRPQITGVIRSQNLRYTNASFGTVIDQINIDGRFAGTRFDLVKLTARAGGGSLSASGGVDLSSANGFPIDIKVKLANAELARSDAVAATIAGDLSITNSRARGALIAGQLNVDQVRYQVAPPAAAEVAELEGVRRKGEAQVVPVAQTTGGPPSVWKLDIGVHAANRVFVGGMGLDAEWASDLKITGDATHPVIVGDIRLVRGIFSFAGRDLTLTRGVIHLDGSPTPNPTLDIEATTTVDTVTAVITIRGTAQAPQIAFSSTPELPQDEVISRLLFGNSVTELSPLQAVQLAAALNSLRSAGGLGAVGKLRNAVGIDRLKLNGADQASGRGPSVGAGKYVAKNIYVEVTTDAKGFTTTQIEIALSRTLRLLSQIGSLGGSSVSLRYSKDY